MLPYSFTNLSIISKIIQLELEPRPMDRVDVILKNTLLPAVILKITFNKTYGKKEFRSYLIVVSIFFVIIIVTIITFCKLRNMLLGDI